MAAKGPTTLPLYQRYVNGVPIPQGRKTLRLREKYIILLVFMTFTIVCLCAFMFLPNMQEKVSEKIQDAQVIFVPEVRSGLDGVPIEKETYEHGNNGNDKKNLQSKIYEAWEQQKVNNALSSQNKINKDDAEKLKEIIQLEKKKQKEEEIKRKLEEAKKINKDHEGHPGARGGEPTDSEAKAKRDKVKEVGLCFLAES